MEEKLLASLNEYVVLNAEHPVGYTRDVLSCISGVMHREKSAIVFHLEAYQNYINLEALNEILRLKDDRIISADLFIGELTDLDNLKLVTMILEANNIEYRVSRVFKDMSNQTSVIYDYVNDTYSMFDYGHDVERIVRYKGQ